MRGLVERHVCRRLNVGVMVTLLFVLFALPSPARAAPEWKGGVAEIEQIRDAALADLSDLGTGFTAFLEDGPSAEDAAEGYAGAIADLQGTGREAIAGISEIMAQFPDSPIVQQTGTFAKGLINASQEVAERFATYQFDEYMEQLGGTTAPPPPTTTTTTPLPTTTTTAALPPTTTTTAPRLVTATTTVPPPTTTTTAAPPPTTTTTGPRLVTTTTTVPRPTTTTTTTPAATPTTTAPVPPSTTTTISPFDPTENDVNGPPDSENETTVAPSSRSDGGPLNLGSGDEGFLADAPDRGSASSTGSREPGLTASLTRVLEPILPAQVTEAVVSPLFMVELLWRAISSSGQGLVAPISLLLFTAISLLWDRRRKKAAPQLTA